MSLSCLHAVKFLFFFWIPLIPIAGISQDLIFMKNHRIEYARIQEVNLGIISYKRWYQTDNALLSVPEEEVVKIRYNDGKEMIFGNDEKLIKNDSVDFSLIYIVYESGMDESQVFPCYINGHFICKLRNHTRLKLKVYTEGVLEITRVVQGQTGPGVFFHTSHGNSYGISIEVPNTQKLAPTDRFRLAVYIGETGCSRFLEREFNSFSPFKKGDIFMEEDLTSPLIR